MRRFPLRAGLIVVGTLAAFMGCKGTAPDHAYPNDPLLISKKPIESSPANAQQPVMVAQRAPLVPPSREDALATRTPDGEPGREGRSAFGDASVRNDFPRITEATALPPEWRR
jgi:hypothetical protein